MTPLSSLRVVVPVIIIAFAAPLIATGQTMPHDGRGVVGWSRNDTGSARASDAPRFEDKAYISGLNQMSRGLDAREAGNLEGACKHFRSAEKAFRRAGDVQSKAWSVSLAEETCPKT